MFEGVFGRLKNEDVILHDCISETPTFEDFKKKLHQDGQIIMIDSLSNALIHYGFSNVYKLLHELCCNKGKGSFKQRFFVYAIFFNLQKTSK